MKLMLRTVLLLFLLIVYGDSGKVKHHTGNRQALKFMKNRGRYNPFAASITGNAGLWPSVFNVATKSLVSVNATCGEGGREEYCKMSEKRKCDICDNFSEHSKHHPVHNAIDGTGSWWQSPALYYGPEYEYVTITLDLKQVYQVTHIIIKAAISPRPGSWILERSIDGVSYHPWQYYARNDRECLERYGIPAKKGKPQYITDTEVICTSYHSKFQPVENGEIHTLMQDRPGANERSPELLEFTKARYVRMRLQGLRRSAEMSAKRLTHDNSKDKKLFYSIKDINIGGLCVCNGHASSCRHNVGSGHPECVCTHNTCGPNCDRCCPLYNQRQWDDGTSRDARQCLPCNCHGHAKSCHYDEDVDRAGLSMDVNGVYNGGGVCDNCTAFTTGINCELCLRGYYRPTGTLPDDETPCTKCNCAPSGSNGICSVQDGVVLCECRPGYAGARCDTCAPGYRGYPNCELCPCDSRGATNLDDCEGSCTCKTNVDGSFCERCKSGYFALEDRNPDGCYRCYCSGVTTLCESAVLSLQTFRTQNGWHVTDISLSTVEKIAVDDGNILSIGSFETSGADSFYWLAPKEYLGNKLQAYGSDFIFKIQWYVMRGDTSGKPTISPNMIIVGSNGMMIAHGNDVYNGPNATFQIPLLEDNWHHIKLAQHEIGEFGKPASRADFLRILTDVKYIMLRAKFHSDQIEVALEEAYLTVGDGTGAVEKCSCPSGYTGLSCESCDYSYVRIYANVSNLEQGYCGKCDCNGHSQTCNADTAQCICEHYTTGETCDRCLPGYYGNPLLGTPEDCKRCACPLVEEDNNFSPSCQLDSFSISNNYNEIGYVCTQCPKGYTGDHCEICDDGYFGLPTVPGGSCQPCLCAGNPCDRTTGQCLACRGNTEGWRCERCITGYFGDPTTEGCLACSCDPIGSVAENCNNVTGQCQCKDNFVGRTCDRCKEGFGNVTAGCIGCDCDMQGSKSNVCDQRTGLCDCKTGVEGFHCDACQHLHYNFSEEGCQSCNCHPRGSELQTCDIRTGKCRCKSYYVGRACDRCQTGFWENSNQGCIKCNCSSLGSDSSECNQSTGQCDCKPGITGLKCDSCMPNFYGFSDTGCKPCDDCSKKTGHICDQKTGRCVCPGGSTGPQCKLCMPNRWNYKHLLGCEECQCSSHGSLKTQCNLENGQCQCKPEFDGQKCDRCRHGYHGYPACKRCKCDPDGTDLKKGNCNSERVCQCADDGTCPCKKNVDGTKCNTCKSNFFGLHNKNPHGCIECFCFGRSKTCKNAPFTWGQIRTKSSRALTRGDITTPNPVIEADRIVGTDGNLVINDIDMYSWMQRSIPLYWSLHDIFKGSKILSYNGYLRFQTESYVDSYSDHQYPLVKIIGNDLELHYYYQQRTVVKQHEIKLQEDEWKIVTKRGPTPVSKAAFMVVLQNVKDILIKATDPIIEEAFSNLTLSIVSLDTAQEISGNPPPRAIGVELCNCPKEYNGSSCENPNLGYYRYRDDHSNIIDAKVGRAEACVCNNRSNVCEIETGKCLNCSSNTAGFYCENCAEGFYNHKGVCQACPCPTPERNFAVSCSPVMKSHLFKCICKEGYTGEKCDECAENYYGNPKLPNGECKPCNCNQYASVNSRCDHYGQCICKKGFTGKQCNQCEKSRHIVKGEDCIPCDQCTQILLDNMDDLSSWLHGNTSWLLSGSIEPPWGKLKEFQDRYNTAKVYFETYERNNTKAKELINQKTIHHLENKTKKIKDNVHDIHSKLTNITRDANSMEEDSDKCYKELDDIQSDLDETTALLENFGKAHVSTKAAVKEANQLLKDIKESQNKISKINHDEVFSKCKTLEDIVREIHKDDILGKILKLRTDMRNITEFLKNTDENLNNIEPIVIETIQRNENNEQEIDRLLGILKEKEKDVEKLTKEMNEANEIVDKTTGILDKTEKTIDGIPSEELKDAIEQLDERQMQLDVEGAKLEEFIEVAKKHTQDLNLKVEHIEKILAQSDKEVNAVKASEAYSNIAKSLREANDTVTTAQKLLDETLGEINSTSNDSLSTKSFIILTASTRLEHRINALQERVKSMTEQLALKENLLSKIRDKAWDNGIKNGEQSKLIQDIHGNYTDFINLKKTMDDAIRQSQAMKKAYQEALDLKHVNMQYDLTKTFEKCKNLTAKPQLNKLGMQVAEAKRKVNDLIHQRLTNFDAYNKQNRTNHALDSDNKSLGEKLDKLKKLIQKSKEIAEEIRVSITGEECQRQYRLNNLRPSLVTELILRFMVHADGPPSPTSLFHIDNEGTDYINVEVNKLSVKFTLKIGQNSETISMDGLKREGHNNATLKRIGGKLTLTVNEEEKSVYLKSGSSVLNVHGANMIHVGGYEKMTGLTNICLDDVIFNKMKIGLWDFVQTGGTPTQCYGCVRNAEKVPGHNIYSRFNGEGYSQIIDDKQQPKEFSITFSLRTFDENALLFLAIFPLQPETYLIITLHDGHIQYEMQYNKTTTSKERTKLKYNSGSKVEVDLRKQYQRGNDIIIMNINRAQETLNSDMLIGGKQLLKIKKADIYLGGVPPDYKIVCVDCPYNAESYQSLLGDIGSFYLTGGHFQLHESAKKHGVEWQDTPFEFEFAWFEGKGFLQLYPLELKDTFSIIFLIRTEKPNGLIIDITNIGEILLENGSISMNLENGHIMTFNTAINDDAYHVIELSRKKSGVYSLKVNDEERTATNNLAMEHPGDLFIGGRLINDHIKFDGELRDLIINDNLIKFNSDTVKEFDNVKIGRSKPQKTAVKQNPNDDMRFRDAQAENIKDMQSTEGCDKVNYNYALEPNAAKFGDVPESYVKYYLKESFWKDEYSIEVEFRTFYKNGMLLFAQGDGKNFYLLELKDNLILLHISGKNRKSLQILKAVDDGQWHKILIERKTKKKKKKIILTVDGVKSKPKRMPQSKIYGEVFIGDVAKTTQHKLRKQLVPKIHPFRGCIKPLKLHINNSPQSFVNHHQIGQCFPNIERGSYFRGDAYAIYNKSYKVVDSLELNFEFRTTEQNGIFLSISSPNDSPALSLELHNGAVVLSVDMGDRIISNVTNSLSEYALCNNRWHNLTALISSELTVNVDGVSKSWVLSDLGHKDDIEGVFYIGGIPDRAPLGTLKVRENFKGCIRNVKIGEEYVDWIDMQELNNVSLNSCPVT